MSPTRSEALRWEFVRELRVQRALEGIDSREARQLARLSGEPADASPDSWELAAAAAHLALLGRRPTTMPVTLRRRLAALVFTAPPVRQTDTTPQ